MANKSQMDEIIMTQALSVNRMHVVERIVGEMMQDHGLSQDNYYDDIETSKKALICETCLIWVQDYLKSLSTIMAEYKQIKLES